MITKNFYPPKCRLDENHTEKCMIFIQSGKIIDLILLISVQFE